MARTARSGFVTPQLATLVDAAPDGPEWLYEVKYDGYRIIAVKDGTAVALFTRNGLDWTDRFPTVARAVSGLKPERLVLDGEVVAFAASGVSAFQLLQQSLASARGNALDYIVFDLLQVGTTDVRRAPLDERRALLARALKGARGAHPPRISEELPGHGAALLTAACRVGLEGIICKRRDAPYESGRARSWLKVKCGKRQEFVVVGYTPPRGSRLVLGSLLLGVHEGDTIRYAGRVGTGMPDALLRALGHRLGPLKRSTPPVARKPARLPPGVQWVEPVLVVEVAFTEWTADGLLRHPALIAVREDKQATEVVRERATRTTRLTGGESDMGTVQGVEISNPQRVVYPEAGLTKRDVAAYIARVAPLMLPHVAGRPLTFLRCPEGIADECFFQKHWTGKIPKVLGTVRIKQGGGEMKPYVVVKDAAGLVTLVQWGILEIHLWGARADDVERPDRVTFDLDPGEGVGWAEMRTAATAVRTLLDAVGLECWLKTSGGKGLHVVVPLDRRSTWDEVSAFARAVAERLSEEAPDKFVSVASKAQRPGKVFVDWLRNTRGATSVAPWSMRARASAGVSVPVPWSRLRSITAGDQYTIMSLSRGKLPADAWTDIGQVRQRLTKQTLAMLTG